MEETVVRVAVRALAEEAYLPVSWLPVRYRASRFSSCPRHPGREPANDTRTHNRHRTACRCRPEARKSIALSTSEPVFLDTSDLDS